MKHQLRNYGFDPKSIVIEDEHFVLGGAVSLPQEILQPDRQWDAFLPVFEPQSQPMWDTDGCTIFGTDNAIEILHKRKFGEERNYSDRFVYIGTKTRPPGNDPHKVADWIRDNGLIDETELPMTATYEEFITPDPLSLPLLGRGQAWRKQYEFGHEWVFKGDISREDKITKMMEALQYSPLGVSVTAWIEGPDGVFIDGGNPNTHWCVCFGFTLQGWKIFDTYDQSVKIYSFDSNISFCKRYSLNKLTQTFEEIQNPWLSFLEFWKRFWNHDYRLFGAMRSSRWSGVRNAHLRLYPNCEICGKNKGLNVHHKMPFHLHPQLELDPNNLVTLCEDGGMNCHITFGHLGNFKSYNASIDEDIKIWKAKVLNRPR